MSNFMVKIALKHSVFVGRVAAQKGQRMSVSVCLPNLSNGIFVAFIPSG
jgi:hypothetical protein